MQICLAPDADHIVFPGTIAATAEASLSDTTDHAFSLTLIDKAVEKAKLAKNAMRQVNMGGEEYLVCMIHPTQTTALRTSTTTGQWLDIQKAAMSGGNTTKNPIFTGALGVYNGVIIRESTRIPSPGTGQANSNVRRAVLLGAQAASMAFGRDSGKGVYSWKEEMFDYGNQLGVAAGCIAGLQKNRFNGSDFATIVISTSTRVS
jgi:N4-gp56 family major capsid protein